MDYKICNRCILDNHDVPDITFDEKGVCNYCQESIRTEMERGAEMTKRPWIYERIRREGKGKKYDVILGLSGGADSSTCLYELIQNGIRPFCFSVDNGYNDPRADENIKRLVAATGVPFFKYNLDLDKYQDIQKAFIKAGVKNIEIPTDHLLMAATYEMAKDLGIRTIISGGNYTSEGIMPKSYGYQARDLKHIKAIYKKFVGKKLTASEGVPLISLLQYLRYRFIDGIRIVNLLDYGVSFGDTMNEPYNREDAVRMLVEKYEYNPYGEKHCENVFTAWFQNYYLPVIWHLDKRKPHYSSLINSGQLTRSEALQLMTRPPEYPKLGIEEKVRRYEKHDYTDYPNNERLWEALGKIYGFIKRRD